MIKLLSWSSPSPEGESMERFNMERERVRVHRDEIQYVEEAFAALPTEEREFIKRYIAEA